jgi:hypothetical protein
MTELEQLKERIEVTRDLMTHPGWGYMHAGWVEELKNLTESTLATCSTEQDLFYRKGVASVLERLVKLADYLDAVEKALDASPEDAE